MLSHYCSDAAFNQVSALSEIIFANDVLHLHVVHLTLADLIWRGKKRGSRWAEKLCGMKGGDIAGIGHQTQTSPPVTASKLPIEKKSPLPSPGLGFHMSD